MTPSARIEAAVSLALTDPDRPSLLLHVAEQLAAVAEFVIDGTVPGFLRGVGLAHLAARFRTLARHTAAVRAAEVKAGTIPAARVLVTARDHVRGEVKRALGALAVSVVLADAKE